METRGSPTCVKSVLVNVNYFGKLSILIFIYQVLCLLGYRLLSQPSNYSVSWIVFFSFPSTFFPVYSVLHHQNFHQWQCSILVTWYRQRHVTTILHCTMYNVQCAMYNVQCAMYNVQCTMYNVQCTMYNVQCTMCNVALDSIR